MGHRIFAQLGMKRHNLQPSFRESSDSLRQQAASTNLPMPFAPASAHSIRFHRFCGSNMADVILVVCLLRLPRARIELEFVH